MTSTGLIRDFTDDEARRALPLKWGAVDPDVLPAWVAEMDYAVAAPVDRRRCAGRSTTGAFGYPPFESRHASLALGGSTTAPDLGVATPGSRCGTSASRSTPSRCCRPST